MTNILKAVNDVLGVAQANAREGNPESHAKLRSEIKRLAALVDTPHEKIANIRFQPMENFALQLAIETGALQALARRNGATTTAELAAETKADETLIYRSLRVLSSIDFCREVDIQTFQANETTHAMIEPGPVGGMYMYSNVMFAVLGKLPEIVASPGINQYPREGYPSPFQTVYGDSFFAWLNENPKYRTQFSNYMAGRRDKFQPQWFDVYPMEDKLAAGPKLKAGDATLLVDIGGNKGHEALGFRKAFDSLPGNVVVQDLAPIFTDVDEVSKRHVEFMAHDFFTPQPLVGARFYYFRATLHNWHDEPATKILAHVAKAMEQGYSSLLIDDFVLPNTGVNTHAGSVDLSMMLIGMGGERTELQWAELLDGVGMEIVKVYRTAVGYESVLEAQLKSN